MNFTHISILQYRTIPAATKPYKFIYYFDY